jgi:hypothetical protein
MTPLEEIIRQDEALDGLGYFEEDIPEFYRDGRWVSEPTERELRQADVEVLPFQLWDLS